MLEREHESGSSLGRIPVRLVLSPCGLLWQDPRPSEEDLARHYAEGEHASGATFREEGPGSRAARLAERRARLLLRHLPAALVPRSWLDVGCGRGDLLAAAEPAGWRRSGLEPSPAAAARARERGFEVRPERLEEAALPPASQGAVSLASVLEHVADPRLALARASALLAPGGTLLVEVPDSARPVAQVAEFYSFEHLTHFTAATLARLLRAERLEPLSIERDGEFSALRAVARRVERAVPPPVEPAEDRAELAAALDRYRGERARLEDAVRARLAAHAARWRDQGARVALFGAGVHSRFLLELVDLGPCLALVLDSDPRKRGSRFCGLEVRHPAEAAELALDAVVLSSRAFQDEMARAVEPLAARGAEVVRVYA